MDDYEALLIKAWSCLSKSQKVEDPVLRRRVLDLAYRCQVLAEAAILDRLHEQGMLEEARAVSLTTALISRRLD
jgi:hypothetical protein